MNHPANRMLCFLLLLAAPLLTRSLPAEPPADVLPVNALTDAEQRGGWQLLFDGKTTQGWRNYAAAGISDGWEVRDGALVRRKKGAGDIVTTAEFDNFELSLEYKISKAGNSGIMFRVTEDAPRPWHSGPEVQIQDNVDGHDPQKAGWLYQLYKPVKPEWVRRFEKQVGFTSPEIDDATRPAGQWNHIYLRISSDQCETAVNGVSYYYFRIGDEAWNQRVAASKFAAFSQFGKAAKGRICLQDHGDLVSFRNIKVRRLAADGAVDNPVDGKLPLKTTAAFPQLRWAGWQPVSDDGKRNPLRPMILTHCGGGDQRIFVATQGGVIHVFPNDPAARRTKLFLDLRGKVRDWQKENEEGLLGLAFHPDYASNGQFFVYYTLESEPHTSLVSRFKVSANDPDRADPDSEEVVIRMPQPFANHNGGSIAFGPDGYLYIALGDGGGRNDPLGHGQNLGSLMGSILRIDVDRPEGGQPYAIPGDNPFRDRAGARPEIFAYGFRNIWRIAFDRSTGNLWLGDVGQDLWEEINLVRRGGNYGWSLREAAYGFGNSKTEPPTAPIAPIWEYDHRIGKSITGGYVYRGRRLPELSGHYLYADYVSGHIWALKYDEGNRKVEHNLGLRDGGVPVLSFGEDADGEVYVLQETGDGKGILRFERKE